MKLTWIDVASWLMIVGFILTVLIGVFAHVALNDCTRDGYSDHRFLKGCIQ